MKSAANVDAVNPLPIAGSGPDIHAGMPRQLAGISPDGAAAACRQSSTPLATSPASASDANAGANERGSAMEGAVIPAPCTRNLDQFLLAQPGPRAPEALVEADLRLVREHPARLLDRVGATPREVLHGVGAHLVLLAAQAHGRVDPVRDGRERRSREGARPLLAEHRE